MNRIFFGAAMAMVLASQAAAQSANSARDALLARARAAELPGEWVPPPGSPISIYAAITARFICHQVFASGFDPQFAERTVGDTNQLMPIGFRAQMPAPVVDRAAREVRMLVPGEAPRVARFIGDLGCVVLPAGSDRINFTPPVIKRNTAPASASWPAGETLPATPPAGIDVAAVQKAVDMAFLPENSLTQAVIVTWKGQIVAERYALGAGPTTPLEGYSMGKSLVATMLGVLMQQGAYTLDQPAPIPEWQGAGDPRKAITIRQILNMSSGLRIRAEQDPEYKYDGRFPDHWYYYAGPNGYAYAASRQPEWPAGMIGRYRNTDPVLGSYLIRLAVEKRGEDYHSFPQRALFDPLNIRTAVLEADANGNFLTQGLDLMSARDWARMGNLYLNDGVVNGKRLLPEGFAKFVSTVAPAWAADGRPVYGGFFWVNGDGALPIPREAYAMRGVGGQQVHIIP
ncbi:MAG: serine hydrolase, partial [Sphingomonadales bacterium]